MIIALKYGLLITVCFVAWVVIAHLLMPNPQSWVHSAGAATFVNVVEILGIYLGISAKREANAGELSFKEGMQTGVSIAFVYAVTSCLFFLIEILIIGPKLLAVKPGDSLWSVAVPAFAGLFLFALILGLVYATIITFFMRLTRRT
jgi:Protein of unknown function (DUF4199)